jgi:hypothetical protein
LLFGGNVLVNGVWNIARDSDIDNVERIKLPQYLIQLESVGLLKETKVAGKSI